MTLDLLRIRELGRIPPVEARVLRIGCGLRCIDRHDERLCIQRIAGACRKGCLLEEERPLRVRLDPVRVGIRSRADIACLDTGLTIGVRLDRADLCVVGQGCRGRAAGRVVGVKCDARELHVLAGIGVLLLDLNTDLALHLLRVCKVDRILAPVEAGCRLVCRRLREVHGVGHPRLIQRVAGAFRNGLFDDKERPRRVGLHPLGVSVLRRADVAGRDADLAARVCRHSGFQQRVIARVLRCRRALCVVRVKREAREVHGLARRGVRLLKVDGHTPALRISVLDPAIRRVEHPWMVRFLLIGREVRIACWIERERVAERRGIKAVLASVRRACLLNEERPGPVRREPVRIVARRAADPAGHDARLTVGVRGYGADRGSVIRWVCGLEIALMHVGRKRKSGLLDRFQRLRIDLLDRDDDPRPDGAVAHVLYGFVVVQDAERVAVRNRRERTVLSLVRLDTVVPVHDACYCAGIPDILDDTLTPVCKRDRQDFVCQQVVVAVLILLARIKRASGHGGVRLSPSGAAVQVIRAVEEREVIVVRRLVCDDFLDLL